jgi:hypothetical protein
MLSCNRNFGTLVFSLLSKNVQKNSSEFSVPFLKQQDVNVNVSAFPEFSVPKIVLNFQYPKLF